ncbi:MAG: ketoacyl-ACP synthase III [Proteobacteria bacterium]|nr:ketoacyl-ACP synthase III [Pseudomonadota bacterium]MCZ6782440.1 ketoacyl-ACP synthase III [Pseudomonadota bacterium]
MHLHGLGHCHPENEITNRFLEELDIGTSDAWILERVGIRSRRTLLPLDYIRETRNRDPRAALEAADMSGAEMGARAARQALERAGISAGDVGMVIAGCSAPDTVSPAEACNVARLLDLEVPAFDVSSACTSFFVGLHLLSMMQPDKLPRFVLVVTPEGLTRTVDYGDRTAAVLWGDAASAAVLSTREPGRAQILATSVTSSPAGADKVVVPRLGHFTQEGRTVQMFAIKKTCDILQRLRAEYEEPNRSFHFIGHQANLRMLETVCQRCEVPEDRHHSNVEWYGNTGAASAASVLSMAWEKWRPGEDVAVVGVGSGLTWAGYLVRFDLAGDAEPC